MNWRKRKMNVTYYCAWIHQLWESFWQWERRKTHCTGSFGRRRHTGLLWFEEVTSAKFPCRGDHKVTGAKQGLLSCGCSELVLGRRELHPLYDSSLVSNPDSLMCANWSDQPRQGGSWAGINIWKIQVNFLHDPAILRGETTGLSPMHIPFLLPMYCRQDHSLWFLHLV